MKNWPKNRKGQKRNTFGPDLDIAHIEVPTYRM
jgi:hypothetical protein